MTSATLQFSVDAQLLKELGERLVGKPATALAELVKNAYDADSTFVEIGFDPDKVIEDPALQRRGEITVRDNGHGMTFADFRDFWMRIGTTHKSDKRVSPGFSRQMTGSKGVGRLSVQFLAHRLELKTVSQENRESWIRAYVDWDKAVEARDLTSATVTYEIHTDPPPFEHGTELRLEWLKQTWNEESLRELAREIWWLQPPFRKDIASLPPAERFEIRFVGAEEAFQEFQEQLDAVLRVQMARVVGVYDEGRARIAIEFWEQGAKVETYPYEYTLKDIADPEYTYNAQKSLQKARFEIHIYKAVGRQPLGLSVGELREYLERFAGVHVYDGPFRLPHYGDFKNDWLEIESEHSKRTIDSKLLPRKIQDAFAGVGERLRYLPTMRRMIGKVEINTAEEANLEITITRDRLHDSPAHEDLRYIVRYALDLYAYHAARRALQNKAATQKTERPSESLRQIEDILVENREHIPRKTYQALEEGLKRVSDLVTEHEKAERDAEITRLSILAPLATAGISALAIQHELRKQFGKLEEIATALQGLRTGNIEMDDHLQHSAQELQSWLERARATNQIFDYMRAETIQERQRYRAKTTIENIMEQLSFMALGVSLDSSQLDDSFYLPEASFAEWGAIFQNIFSNAFNAMYGCPQRILSVSSRAKDNRRTLLVQDTGIGVDLRHAERLFEPFERGIKDDPVRQRLGYGGTGLGLTIVRLLCERIGCLARFVKPETGFSTAFSLEWDEKKAKR